MTAQDRPAGPGPARIATAAALAAGLLAVFGGLFALNYRGPLACPPPGSRTPGKAGKPAQEKTFVKASGDQADIPGLSRRLEADIKSLVGADGSGRLAGSPGEARALAMVRERFEKAGLQNVCVQEFEVAVPVTAEAAFSVEGEAYPIHPLWPNVVRTATTSGEIKGHLVWAADARLERLAGQDVDGSILVVRGDRGHDWLTAASLGVRAVVFLEPADSEELQLQTKVLSSALDIPRFWMPRAEGDKLVRALEIARSEDRRLNGLLKCRVDWQPRTTGNVYGLLPGSRPDKARDVTILTAPLDSNSLVPDLAPGADSGSSLAALLEILDRLKTSRPERSVLFLAAGAHSQAMLGETRAADLLRLNTAKLVEEIAGLDGTVLGADPYRILLAAGLPVEGLQAWKRVVLIVLGVLLAAGTVILLVTVRPGRKATAGIVTAAVLLIGGLPLLGLRLGRERTAAAEEQAGMSRDAWRACAYAELRRRISRLAEAHPEPASRLIAAVEKREAAERAAVEARGRAEQLQREEAKRRKDEPGKDKGKWSPPPPEWQGRFAKAAAELDRCVQAACGPQLTEDFRQMKAELEAVRAAAPDDRAARRVIESCLTALADQEDRIKNSSPSRLRYRRLAGNLGFLAAAGPDLPERVSSCIALDLSSHSERMAVFFKGRFVNQGPDENVSPLLPNSAAPLASFMAAAGSAHAGAQGWSSTEAAPFVINTTESGPARSWGSVSSAAPCYGSEPFTLSGIPAVTLGTAYDGRALWDTPLDLPGRMDLAGLARQTEVAARTIADVFGSSGRGLAALEKMETQSKVKGNNQTIRISGLVTEYNPAKSRTLSVIPVPGALVLSRREAMSGRSGVLPFYLPVRTWSVTLSDDWGGYEFIGFSAATARIYGDIDQRTEAFSLDPASGRIVRAIDQSRPGAWKRPTRVEETLMLGTFKCSALNLYEVSDLRNFEGVDTQLTNMNVLLGLSDASPVSFGWSMVGETGDVASPDLSAVLFVEQRSGDKPVRVKATMGRRRLAGLRWPMLVVPGEGWQKDSPEWKGLSEAEKEKRRREIQSRTYMGKGVDVGGSSRLRDRDSGRVVPSCLMMAQDLWRLDDYRLFVLDRAGIENSSLNGQHREAGAQLEAALEARDRKLWDRMMAAARASCGFEVRAYPAVLSTVTDVVKGLLFYLFLMLPFAFFVERLIFAFPDINRQLTGVFGIFMATFLVLAFVHPAFRITNSAPMILLAFITVALAILVIGMISSRFKRELDALRQRPGRGRKADMDRFNAAISAFLLGINNMRRRKVRTALTLVTLVLLTFSVLSFSSIQNTLGVNRRVLARDKEQPYRGILLRNESWFNLGDSACRSLRDEFAPEGCAVSPRAWISSPKTLINVSLTGSPERFFNVGGVLGVTGEEAGLSGLGRPEMLLPGGRFFGPEDRFARVCLLTETMAAKLGVNPSDVRAGVAAARLPQVTVWGSSFAVVGILADEAFGRFRDIDDESPVPLNLEVENWQRGSGSATASETLEFRKYTHLDPREVLVLPYELALNHGGRICSVALVPPEGTDPFKLAEERLLRRISVPLFVSGREPESGRPVVTFMSSAKANAVSGVGSLVVPMLIAALIVLNTMLGAVYEREKEIFIFGSLGLAPIHIGSLFIAESAVFAVVSSVLGYVLGQSVGKLTVMTGAAGLLGGINLNYSSLSAVFSACFIIGVVMLSAAYPAIRAGQLSVPDVERIWRFPKPDGDRLVFDFPFTVSGEQALGINMHLVHYFEDHANQSVGEFYTAGTAFVRRTPGDLQSGCRLGSSVWIAPFDFGISQRLELETFLAAGEKDLYETRMVLTRLSGSPEAWVMMNHRFMKGIRKQFLLWRLFSQEERAWHVAQARAKLGEAPPPPPPGAEAAAATAGG